MSKNSVFEAIKSQQNGNGAFPSNVHLPSGKVTDYNVFVAALVLDFLYDYIELPLIAEVVEKALKFILSCQCTVQEGHFRFYPAGSHPKWINEILNPDIDDSALCIRILHKYGIWNQDKVSKIVQKIAHSYRTKKQPSGAIWFRTGVFPTWLDRSLLHNPIDVVANLNMLQLIHESTCDNVLYAPIIEMTNLAIESLNEESSLELISPYYVQTNELLYALERCKKAGVSEMNAILEKYHKKNYTISMDRNNTTICCSYGNGVYWSSSLLSKIRNVR